MHVHEMPVCQVGGNKELQTLNCCRDRAAALGTCYNLPALSSPSTRPAHKGGLQHKYNATLCGWRTTDTLIPTPLLLRLRLKQAKQAKRGRQLLVPEFREHTLKLLGHAFYGKQRRGTTTRVRREERCVLRRQLIEHGKVEDLQSASVCARVRHTPSHPVGDSLAVPVLVVESRLSTIRGGEGAALSGRKPFRRDRRKMDRSCWENWNPGPGMASAKEYDGTHNTRGGCKEV